MSLFTETVVLRTQGEPTGNFDDRGRPIYGDPVDTDSPAWYEPRGSTENVDARDQQIWGYWVYLPLDVDLSAVDAVVISGIEYQVVGEPGRQPGGFIVDGYVQAAVQRETG